MRADKVQSLIVLPLKHTCTNVQTCSPSLQPWEWRMLRFKVISSIQQPGALHCQCTTSLFAHTRTQLHAQTQALTNTLLVGIHSTHGIPLTLASETEKCLSGENMTLRQSAHTHKQSQPLGNYVWVSPLNTIKSLGVRQKASQTHTVQLLTFWRHNGGPC